MVPVGNVCLAWQASCGTYYIVEGKNEMVSQL
jgi:hypothetical protein